MRRLKARVIRNIGTESAWLQRDTVLGDGEIALVRFGGRVRQKVGTGTLRFSQLSYQDNDLKIAKADPTFPFLSGEGAAPAGVYMATASGTYQPGNVVVDTNGKMVMLLWDGEGSLDKVETELPDNSANAKEWEAKAYTVGSLVSKNGLTWKSLEPTLPTDEPGVSPKWFNQTPLKEDSTGYDLALADKTGTHNIVQYSNGHVKTKKFDSRNVEGIVTENGNITTENFNSSNVDKLEVSVDEDDTDYQIIGKRIPTTEDPNPIPFILLELKDGHVKTKNFNSKDFAGNLGKEVKALFISNSFGRDAVMYAPSLLEEMGASRIVFGVLYVGGSTLSGHWTRAVNGDSPYAFDRYDTKNGFWETTGNNQYSLEQGLKAEDWDIVVFNQQSASSSSYSTYQPYLNNLVNFVNDKVTKPVKIGFLQIPSKPDNSTTGAAAWGSTLTSDAFFAGQVSAYEQIEENSAVELFIPCGTAIQNARKSGLSAVGAGGNLVYSDMLHLQEGLPCLIEAYVTAMVFAKEMGLPTSVIGSKIRPTQEWIIEKNVIERHGTSTGVTEANVLIAQKCAVSAVKKPRVITELNY